MDSMGVSVTQPDGGTKTSGTSTITDIETVSGDEIPVAFSTEQATLGLPETVVFEADAAAIESEPLDIADTEVINDEAAHIESDYAKTESIESVEDETASIIEELERVNDPEHQSLR